MTVWWGSLNVFMQRPVVGQQAWVLALSPAESGNLHSIYPTRTNAT